ncbi:hypothetical protein P4N68_07940 [Corynebacterium felinum]|uniref:Uncharacterized protein n=1 Tax=Corynebacterium felinum TaxID=131318 RepID=A0ABU2BC53_9CORY|nr:hypothetical protein [Corynebacterium felinum]MDF5821009.1 hypothetical protein [Corynebacterium felinum]MDR7356214.1 hypothetical protein [Corynebacterium felinum]WJY95546.1 hypothetical protein CFELI_09720 [Corynebacterium felinum]
MALERTAPQEYFTEFDPEKFAAQFLSKIAETSKDADDEKDSGTGVESGQG